MTMPQILSFEILALFSNLCFNLLEKFRLSDFVFVKTPLAWKTRECKLTPGTIYYAVSVSV